MAVTDRGALAMTIRRRKRPSAVLLLVFGLLLQRGASAQAPPSEEVVTRATNQYEEGRRLLSESKPREALAALEASLQLLPSPNTELLEGHALRMLGRRSEALLVYERAMEGATTRVRAGEERFRRTLAEAGRWEAVLRAELGELTVSVTHAPGDVTVTIDAASVETARDAATGTFQARKWLEPGRVRVVAAASSGGKREQVVELRPGAANTVSFDFGAAPAAARSGSRGPPAASWIAAGVGVAGLAAFAVFGAMAESEDGKLSVCSPNCDETDPSLRDASDRRSADATAANVSLAIGAAGIVAAGVIWLVASQRSPASAGRPARARRPFEAAISW